MTAAEKGHTEVVVALLMHPLIDVNLCDKKTQRRFGSMSYNGNDETRYLVTPLMIAAARGHVGVVTALLSHPSINTSVEEKVSLSRKFCFLRFKWSIVTHQLISTVWHKCHSASI